MYWHVCCLVYESQCECCAIIHADGGNQALLRATKYVFITYEVVAIGWARQMGREHSGIGSHYQSLMDQCVFNGLFVLLYFQSYCIS